MKYLKGILFVVWFAVGCIILWPMIRIGDLGRSLSEHIFEPVLDALDGDVR